MSRICSPSLLTDSKSYSGLWWPCTVELNFILLIHTSLCPIFGWKSNSFDPHNAISHAILISQLTVKKSVLSLSVVVIWSCNRWHPIRVRYWHMITQWNQAVLRCDYALVSVFIYTASFFGPVRSTFHWNDQVVAEIVLILSEQIMHHVRLTATRLNDHGINPK